MFGTGAHADGRPRFDARRLSRGLALRVWERATRSRTSISTRAARGVVAAGRVARLKRAAAAWREGGADSAESVKMNGASRPRGLRTRRRDAAESTPAAPTNAPEPGCPTMSSIAVSVVLVLAFILCIGLCTLAESALGQVQKWRLRDRASRGDRGAQAALEVACTPDRFSGAMRLLVALASVLVGLVGGVLLCEHTGEATIARRFGSYRGLAVTMMAAVGAAMVRVRLRRPAAPGAARVPEDFASKLGRLDAARDGDRIARVGAPPTRDRRPVPMARGRTIDRAGDHRAKASGSDARGVRGGKAGRRPARDLQARGSILRPPRLAP